MNGKLNCILIEYESNQLMPDKTMNICTQCMNSFETAKGKVCQIFISKNNFIFDDNNDGRKDLIFRSFGSFGSN